MGTGNNDVGKGLTIDAANRSTAIASRGDLPIRNTKSAGEMSHQGYGFHGNECYQQKLVQLVGYRDAHASADAWDRLRIKQASREKVG